MNPIPVYVPMLNANDDVCILVEIHAACGELVRRGALLFSLETSKTHADVEAPHDGYFYTPYSSGQELRVASLLAVIGPAPEALPEIFRRLDSVAMHDETPPAAEGRVRMSKAAVELARRYGLSEEDFNGMDLVTTAEIERLWGRQQRCPHPNAGVIPGDAVRTPEGGRVVVVGAGGHAGMCLDVLRSSGSWEVAGFLDPARPVGEQLWGLPILGGDEYLRICVRESISSAVNAVGSVTDPGHRAEVFERIREAGLRTPNLVHETAAIEPSSEWGTGNQVFALAAVGSHARIADNCIINTGAIVSHDCEIENHVHVAPGAVLGGGVQVGEGALIGMGATVFLGVRIGRNVVIANGAHVFSDVPDGACVRH
ncbi:MAG: NeuD/PglB/VioB family sugar acetyltransferase [Phycisphaerae bacterium]|nr:NeuD/PglB/VioB family sugar acetyltransferase [Phycisphaerae bacterium]